MIGSMRAHDIIIIGGGAAGLSAAELLGRARRDVLVDLSAELGRAGCVVERWPHALAELPAVRALGVQHVRRELP